jgi:hypothetical protein
MCLKRIGGGLFHMNSADDAATSVGKMLVARNTRRRDWHKLHQKMSNG